MIELIESQQSKKQISEEEAQEQYFMVYKVLDKITFELSVGIAEQDHLTITNELLLKVVKNSNLALEHLVEERILEGIIEKKNEDDESGQMIDTAGQGSSTNKTAAKTLEDKPFFDMLLTHRSQDVRNLCEKLLTKVMTNLFERVSDQNQSDE